MSPFQVAAVLVALAAVSTYINFRLIHLPAKIGAMAIALAISLIIVGVGALGAPLIKHEAQALVKGTHFSGLLLDGALAFLLFAAALDVNFADLKNESAPVTLLATAGVVISTVLVGDRYG